MQVVDRAATASTSGSPRASRAAIADESVQPVPWSARVASRGCAKSCNRCPSQSRSTTSSPGGVAALDQHRAGKLCPARARARAGRLEVAAAAARRARSASGRFGVDERRERQQRVAQRARPRRRASSGSPLLATITGSTTIGTAGAAWAASRSATTATAAPASASMPILTASTPMSSSTASICARDELGRHRQDAAHSEACSAR